MTNSNQSDIFRLEESIRDLVDKKNLQEARMLIEQGIGKYKNQKNLLRLGAFCCQLSQDWNESLKYSTQLINKYPQDPDGWIMTNVSLCKLGKTEQAEILLKKGTSLNPNSIYLLTAAYLLKYKLEKKESLQRYREMIKNHPKKVKLLDQSFFWHYSRLPDRKQTNAIALAELLIFVHPTKRFGYLLLSKIMIHQQEY